MQLAPTPSRAKRKQGGDWVGVERWEGGREEGEEDLPVGPPRRPAAEKGECCAPQ